MSHPFFFVQPTPGGLYELRRTLFRDDPENPAARVLLASSLEELLRLVSGSLVLAHGSPAAGDRTAMDTDAIEVVRDYIEAHGDERPKRRSVPAQLALPWIPPVEETILPKSGALDQLLDQLRDSGQGATADAIADQVAGDVDSLRLTTAQVLLRAGLDNGTTCLCCGKHAQRYKRGINSTMVRGLIWLVRMSGADREWIQVQEVGPAWLLRSKQLPTLRYWGLVEPRPIDPEDTKKKRSGIWRPTSRGIDFVYGRIKVPRFVREYTGLVDAFDEEQIHVRGALHKKFDYYALMGWEVKP